MPGQLPRQHRRYWLHRRLNWLAGIGGKRGVFWCIRVPLQITLWIGAGVLTLVSVCDPHGQQVGMWTEVVIWLHSHRFIIALLVMALAGPLQLCVWIMARLRLVDVAKLEQVLDHVAAKHFTAQDRSKYVYRATLFKVRPCWFCGSWLGIVARSGILYPQRTTVFSIDAKSRKHNTGIAGECWRREGQTLILELPEPSDKSTSQNTVGEYKTAGYLDDREYEMMSVYARVFLATGIRVRGKIWGVLVLDSTDPTQHPSSRQQQKRHREDLEFAAIALSQLATP